MPENPLLPHRKLRELYALMLRIRDLERKQKSATAREALLGATTMQLQPGDLLAPAALDLTAAQLAPASRSSEPKRPSTTGLLATLADQRLPQAAAAAKALQCSGNDALVLALTHAGAPEPGWQAALDWAQTAQLPLLLACADLSRSRQARAHSQRETLDYAALSRFARRNKLAVLTVDGEDAVAVYRVMQESVLRARNGGGPAVLWAIMSPSGKLPRSAQPITRLRTYLNARAISL